MNLLVVGGTGFLGRELVRQAVAGGHWVAASSFTRRLDVAGVAWHPLDIRKALDVVALTESIRPDMVINAAYRQADWRTTADGAAHVALAAAAIGARLVQISSDTVFSGTAVHYDETCVPDPITPYGAAKAAAETAIRAIVPGAVIVRTSLIIGDGDSPHESLVHALAAGTGNGAVLFTDDIRCPIHVSDLAAALLELAASRYTGVHHVAGAHAVSRYELGLLVARRDGLDGGGLPTGRRAETGPPGPLDVRLDCTRTQAQVTTRFRGAREFLERC